MKNSLAPSKNTSATGGYLRPATVEVNDGELMDVLQAWFSGLTGLDEDAGVVIEFQKNPAPQADAEVSWLSIGMGRREPDFDPSIRHVGSSLLSAMILLDAVTAIPYNLVVSSGHLQLVRGFTDSGAVSSFVLLDTATSDPFTVTVRNGAIRVLEGGNGDATSVRLADLSGSGAWQVVITKGQLVVDAPVSASLGSDVLYQNEVFEVDCSAYGPQADAIYAAVWNNARIAQNLDPLRAKQIGLVRVGAPTPLNEQLAESNRWIRRVDFQVRLRRAVTLTYPVEDILSAEVVFIVDTPPIQWNEVVTED